MLSVAKALNKVEGLHKRAFGYLFNKYISPYDIVFFETWQSYNKT